MELTSNAPASPAPSQEQAPATSQPAAPQPITQPATPAEGQSPSQPQINLYELPQFRNYQAAITRQLAEREQEAARYRQEADQLRQQYMQALPEEDRPAYEAQALQQQLQSAQQQLQAMQAQQVEAQKAQALNELSSQYGVPAELLASATDWNSAEAIAKRYSEAITQRAAELAAAQADKANRNNSFLGGGAPVTTQTIKDERYQEAMKKRDAATVLSLLFDA